ncbi:hypothetical protein ACFE04_019807 [Oxalis oulophora]
MRKNKGLVLPLIKPGLFLIKIHLGSSLVGFRSHFRLLSAILASHPEESKRHPTRFCIHSTSIDCEKKSFRRDNRATTLLGYANPKRKTLPVNDTGEESISRTSLDFIGKEEKLKLEKCAKIVGNELFDMKSKGDSTLALGSNRVWSRSPEAPTKNFWSTHKGEAPASAPTRKARQKIFGDGALRKWSALVLERSGAKCFLLIFQLRSALELRITQFTAKF